MSFFDRFWKKENPVAKSILAQVRGQKTIWTPVEYNSLAQHGYMRNVYAYAAIRLIAQSTARIPFNLMQKGVSRKSKAERIYDHLALDLLDNPAPRWTRTQFMDWFTSFHVYSGNGYIVASMINGVPGELYSLRPDRIDILKGDLRDEVKGYVYGAGSDATPIEEALMLHVKSFHPLNDWFGMGAMEPAAQSIDESNSAKQMNVNLLQNQGRTPAFIHFKRNLTDEQYDAIKAQFDSMSDPAQAGKMQILESSDDITLIPMSMSPTDMDWLEGQVMAAREIAIAWNVPPELLGDSANKTYSNVKEARLALYEENIVPRIEEYAKQFTNFLLPKFDADRMFFEPDLTKVSALRDKQFMLWDMAGNAFERGLLNKGRALEIMGEDADVDDKDLKVLRSSLSPLLDEEEVDDGKLPPPSNDDGDDEEEEDDKAFALGDEKEMLWRAVDRKRRTFIPSVQKLALRMLNNDTAQIVSVIKSSKSPLKAVDTVLSKSHKAWDDMIVETNIRVGRKFAQDVWKDIDSQKSADLYFVKGPTEDLWLKLVTDFIKTNGVSRLKGLQITETTRIKVRRVLSQGLMDGKSVETIAAELSTTMKGLAPARALAIARTEVIGASNLGSQKAAEATGLPIERTWLTTRDGAAREWHIEADAQVAAQGEAYEVNGESLMYPGDISLGASANNVVNCRCTETFKVVKDD